VTVLVSRELFVVLVGDLFHADVIVRVVVADLLDAVPVILFLFLLLL
jgi:hypothetical protein